MVKIIKKTVALFTNQQNNILSAATVIMSAVALSRVLGLLRDRLLASRFTPDELGVYYAAFRLPNMIFELLVMGALATAFIPVFTEYLDTKGKEHAFKLASNLITIGVVFFLILSIPVLIFSKEVCTLLAPGFNPDQIEKMILYTRIMIIAQVFPLIIGNFYTGILQSFRNFLIPSLAPVVYNVGIIVGIIFLTPQIGLLAPVIGVVLGAILFTLIQIPLLLKLGYRYRMSLEFKEQGTREVAKLMIPRTLGLAVSQIDTTVDLILSTLLGASAVTVFNFAQHLQQLPVGLFGASIAQATLPALASSYALKKEDEFKNLLTSSFHQINFFVIPLSVLLIVLRIPLVRLVFGASALFDWPATVLTGRTLAFFSLSLFAQSLVHLLARAYYALHDSKTPVIIGIISVATNSLLSVVLVLVLHWDVWSLGLSTSVASVVNMALLFLYLDRRLHSFNKKELFFPSLKIGISGIVSGVALYIPIKLLDQLVFDTTRTINLILLTGIATSAGLFVYLLSAWFLDVPQISLVGSLLRKVRTRKTPIIIDTTQEVIENTK